MMPAEQRLARDLKELTFHHMRMPLVKNIDGAASQEAEKARDALIRQVTGAVQWVNSMRTLIDSGVKTFVEVGPGKVLCGLMRQIDRAQTCLNVEDEASLQKAMNRFEPRHVSDAY
jgi:[acyl-carrier-protein] S-malonyltransferase